MTQFLWTCSLQTQSGAVFTSTWGRDRPPLLLLLATTLTAAESTWLYWRPVECQSDCQVKTQNTRKKNCLFCFHQWELFQLMLSLEDRRQRKKKRMVWLETRPFLSVWVTPADSASQNSKIVLKAETLIHDCVWEWIDKLCLNQKSVAYIYTVHLPWPCST